jgi:DnaJ family protein C protein 28
MPSIEELINKAIGEGKFDDLPGKGKPMRLDENPHADPEWRLAHHMLHSSGYTLPWIALRQEIEHDLEAARGALRRAWEWRAKKLAESAPPEEIEAEWQRGIKTFEHKIAKINRQIADYNIQTPSEKLQLTLRKLERELQIITGSS